ncbi:hypothetical protein ACFOY2_52875 [Nonomuraea purpurea]|uniref:Elongation factor Ts n=1 Tax=Nonomuraea purpurea TaxID=1849276 RepID=A0ABV8GT54_9ACTN
MALKRDGDSSGALLELNCETDFDQRGGHPLDSPLATTVLFDLSVFPYTREQPHHLAQEVTARRSNGKVDHQVAD